MMNAEIASEMIRSRSQTPRPALMRSDGSIRAGAWADPECGTTALFDVLAPAFDPGFEEPSGMHLYCIQKRLQNQQVIWLSFTMSELG